MSKLDVIMGVQFALALAIVGVTYARRHRLKTWVFLATNALAACISGFAFQSAILIVNAVDGCYPFAPREVPYHDGMTLCPGQSTHMQFEFEFPPGFFDPAPGIKTVTEGI